MSGINLTENEKTISLFLFSCKEEPIKKEIIGNMN